MRILIDAEIWGVPSLFAGFGEVSPFDGRAIGPVDVRGANALIVRSVTRVDAALLNGSDVQFVGSATSGDDHVDRAYLNSRGIAYCNAAGCNSRPVAEYVLAALCEWAERAGGGFVGRTLGVFGMGRIGSKVANWAEALGIQVLACDPPLARSGRAGLVDAQEVLAAADVVSLHMPLTRVDDRAPDAEPWRRPSDATLGMVNAAWLRSMRRGAWLINTCRGEVVSEADLIDALDSGQVGGAILDVWSDEPSINEALLSRAAIGTPHMAGYSADAHRRAAERMAAALAAFRTHHASGGPCERTPNASASHPPSTTPSDGDVKDAARVIPMGRNSDEIAFARHKGESEPDFLARLLAGVCNLRNIDARLRASPETPMGVAFDSVRRSCRDRSELPSITVSRTGLGDRLAAVLAHLDVPLAE